MRSADATDSTYDGLTAEGTVVVAFYTEGGSAGRFNETRRALISATWQHDRGIRVVFVDYGSCRATCDRLGVFGFPAFWLLKDGKHIGTNHVGHTQSMRRLRRIAFEMDRKSLAKWLSESLPQARAKLA